MKKIFIHVGFHKTATTWFQNQFFPQHPQVVQLGKNPHTRLPEDIALNKKLQSEPDLSFSTEECRELVKRIERKKPLDGKVYGLSNEGLSAGRDWFGSSPLYVADRLKKVFKDHDVKIIIGIRNQPSMLASLYNEYVRQGGTLTLKKLLFSPNPTSQALRHKFLYHKFIKYYQQQFGKQNIHTYIFEELQKKPQKTTNNICDFLNIKRISNTRTRRANQGISKVTVTLLRIANMLCSTNLNTAHISPFTLLASVIARITFIFRKATETLDVLKPLSKRLTKNMHGKKPRYIEIYWYENVLNKKMKGALKMTLLTLDKVLFLKNIFGKYRINKNLKRYLQKHYKEDNKKTEKLLDKNLKQYGYY